MTDDEQRKLDEIHRALFQPAPGDDKPFIVRLQIMSRDWNRMGWAARSMVFLVMTASGVILAWDRIVDFLKRLVS